MANLWDFRWDETKRFLGGVFYPVNFLGESFISHLKGPGTLTNDAT